MHNDTMDTLRVITPPGEYFYCIIMISIALSLVRFNVISIELYIDEYTQLTFICVT